MVTKGYGLTIDDIDWSCPADLEPYSQAFAMRENLKDTKNWQLGQYVAEAISCVFSKEKYPNKPVFQIEKEETISAAKESREVVAVYEMQQRINQLRQQGLPESPI